MIVITGGAGFIGSALLWRLNKIGLKEIIVVDHLGSSEKWKNLVGLSYLDYLDREVFIEKLERGDYGNSLELILHMGACSATTELNADYLVENNYRFTKRIAEWRENHSNCRFIYASSAATYGNGDEGYNDDEVSINKLRPLNMYGYSKHMFDLLAKDRGWFSDIVGLKYFNVFGPNEYHKGDMKSVICKAFKTVRDKSVMSLFKSYNSQYADGEQKRDFIYVKDVVEMVLFFMEHKEVNGLFNIGTGIARSWNDVANSMFKALNKESQIDYISMPETIRDKYQYFTCADMEKLQAVGCNHKCMSLEDSISDYIQNYLINDRYLSEV